MDRRVLSLGQDCSAFPATLRHTHAQGHHVVATTALAEGEVALQSAPSAAAPPDAVQPTTCLRCFARWEQESSDSHTCCHACQAAFYCSTACQEADAGLHGEFCNV
jgi:MYND finger